MGKLLLKSQHKLMCADSTNKECVDLLMNGEKADMVYTDPPYGIDLDTRYKDAGFKGTNFKRKRHNWKPIAGDKKPFNPSQILKIECDEIFIFGGDYFCKELPDNGSWLVWDKTITETGDKVIGSNFELCWSKQKHKRSILRVLWSGVYGHSRTDDGANKMHPTQKPVKLAESFFEKWGKGKTNIVDLFGGSGSTLIACEKTKRKCFMSEIDPYYCQVIIDRWENYTNSTAIKQ